MALGLWSAEPPTKSGPLLPIYFLSHILSELQLESVTLTFMRATPNFSELGTLEAQICPNHISGSSDISLPYSRRTSKFKLLG